jgi:hypothetical protein
MAPTNDGRRVCRPLGSIVSRLEQLVDVHAQHPGDLPTPLHRGVGSPGQHGEEVALADVSQLRDVTQDDSLPPSQPPDVEGQTSDRLRHEDRLSLFGDTSPSQTLLFRMMARSTAPGPDSADPDGSQRSTGPPCHALSIAGATISESFGRSAQDLQQLSNPVDLIN